MQLLTDEEIGAVNFVSLDRLDYEVFEVDQSSVMEFARAVESALLAKLGAMELPEPAMLTHGAIYTTEKPWYTADQLRQAYAQGAAAQLAEKPSAKQFQTPDGKWHSFLDLQHEEHTVNDGRWPIRELYTRREA